MARKATQRKAQAKSGSGKTPTRTTRKKATVKAAPPAEAEPEIVVTHEQIAERAYHLWQASGHMPGRDCDNWIEAERQLQHGEGIA